MAVPYVLTPNISLALRDQEMSELALAPGTAITVTFTGELVSRSESRTEDPADGSEVVKYQYNVKFDTITAIT